MITDRASLTNFLSSSAQRTDAMRETNITRMTDEEMAELRERAMRNLGITEGVADVAQTTSSESTAQQAAPDVVASAMEAMEVEDPSIPTEERAIRISQPVEVRSELVRFSDAEWFKKVQEKVIVLAGVGGIGSNMAMILAKLNPASIYIFDDDTVETENLAGQFYSSEDVGKYKVDALAASVIKYTNYSTIFAVNRRYLVGESISSDIMVCGFDNMGSRKAYFKTWKERMKTFSTERKKGCLFIDGRLTAEEFQIFCMTGADDYYIKKYQDDYLFNDYEANSLPCSYKQTGFLADMIGAFMVNLIVNFCANQVNPLRNMSLPFRTSYRTDMMFLDCMK